MGLLNKEKMAAVMNTALATWDGTLAAAKPTWDEWALRMPSSTGVNTYHWADLLVQIREWVGERKLQSVRAQAWPVPNKNFEGAFPLSVNDINDDQIGLLRPQTENLLNAALNFPEDFLFGTELAAFGTLCYDGQYFFDTDHPALTDDGTTVANLVTDPFTYDNLKTALVHFMKVRGSTGQVLALDVTEVHVGPKYFWTAEEFFKNQFKPGAAGEDNSLRNRAKPRLNPYFVGDYAEYWTLLAKPRNGNLTAFAYQEREAPTLKCTAVETTSAIAGITAQDVKQFMEDVVLFGTKLRGAATFTLWALGYGSTGTGV